MTDKLPQDIQEMEKRIARAKLQGQHSGSSKPSQLKMFLENAFRMAAEFVAPVIVGLCIGYFADNFFNTKPILMLIMIIFGCASGVLNVYRVAQEMDKKINEE